MATMFDLVVVGAGAAGLATAIFAARFRPEWRIVTVDGARKLGAKILVSGGGRCNLTNVRVTPEDFRGGNPNVIRRILQSLSVEQTLAFFQELGVSVHEEEHGKLFPDTHSARTVLDALVAETWRRGIQVRTEHRVRTIQPGSGGFYVDASQAILDARRVVLAMGGRSLPKTGSDGFGYEMARRLGHTIVPPTPALVPLLLDGGFHRPLSGISHDVVLNVRIEGRRPALVPGALLWTHFGISGPAVLDASGLWERARLENRPITITARFLPEDTPESIEKRFLDCTGDHPKELLRTAVARWLPARVAETVLQELEIDSTLRLAHVPREVRRRLNAALLDWPLPIVGSRGYNFAEVTSGGVPLMEIDPGTLESRTCPGLFLVGEILDVDGRIGGFNFQWAWSTAFVAARGMSRID